MLASRLGRAKGTPISVSAIGAVGLYFCSTQATTNDAYPFVIFNSAIPPAMPCLNDQSSPEVTVQDGSGHSSLLELVMIPPSQSVISPSLSLHDRHPNSPMFFWTLGTTAAGVPWILNRMAIVLSL